MKVVISYDPDKHPELSNDAVKDAESLNMQIVNVICDEPGAKVGDNTGVAFLSITPFVPRIGERIKLEDGTMCEVKMVFHRVSRLPDTKTTALVPTVLAVRLPG